MSDESWRGRVGRLDEAEISTFLAEAHLARLAASMKRLAIRGALLA
jgi:hypothetical protein